MIKQMFLILNKTKAPKKPSYKELIDELRICDWERQINIEAFKRVCEKYKIDASAFLQEVIKDEQNFVK